jgi:DNA-binding CsgD family transcriptional regulator
VAQRTGGRGSFVGREAELARLAEAWRRAQQDRPCLAVVEGPGGIGKTALVDAFLESVVGGSGCALRASGEETESGLAFGVLDQLLGSVSARGGGRGGTGLLAALRGEDRGAIEPMTAGAGLLDALGELQRSGPVIAVVDDVQWADGPSLQALVFALRRLAVDRVMVVLMVRDVAVPDLPEGLRRLLASDHATRVTLPGLSADEIRTLSGMVTGTPLSLRAAERLQAHTAGNALHTRAMLDELPVAAFEDPHVPLPAPRSFALLVHARLARCRAGTRDLVAAASVLGGRCKLHAASDLAAVDDALEALDEATASGLLVELPATQPVPVVAFPHPLVRSAVDQQLGARRRTALHLRAADLAGDERTRLGHRFQAVTGPDAALAADLAAFGRRRRLAGDWATAGEQLAAAAAVATERADEEQLTAEAIDCQLMAGGLGDLTGPTARLHTFDDTGWRNYVLARLALATGRLDEAQALFEQAWERCESDPGLAARVAGQLAWLFVARDRGGDAVRWIRKAREQTGDGQPTDISRLIEVVARSMTGEASDGLALLDDLPDAAHATVADLDGLLGRVRLRSWHDDLDAAHRDLVAVVDAAQSRSMTFRLAACAMLAEVEFRLGRWDEARVHGLLAVSLAVDGEQTWLTSICDSVASFVPAVRGQWAQAEAHVDAAAARIMDPGHVLAACYLAGARAQLAAARNEPEQVIDALRPMQERDPTSSVFEPSIYPSWQDLLVEALVAVGRLDEAEAVLGPFAERAAERRRHSAIAAAARARGRLLAARREEADAEAAFHEGIDHARQVDMPFELGLLELATGAFLRRAGRRSAAADHLREAAATFGRLGARPYLERCDRELAACGTEGGPVRAATPGAHGPSLTPQEFAVAHLAAQGRTNRQIAVELVISVKTVEYHLSHVYTKLQVSTRVQMARVLGRSDESRGNGRDGA